MEMGSQGGKDVIGSSRGTTARARLSKYMYIHLPASCRSELFTLQWNGLDASNKGMLARPSHVCTEGVFVVDDFLRNTFYLPLRKPVS